MVFVIHWHESAMDLHVFPIPSPSPTSLSTRFLWVFPVPQARALVPCIPSGLVICFTLDNIHISMLFSRNIPPSPSPTESKILFCTSKDTEYFHLRKFCLSYSFAVNLLPTLYPRQPLFWFLSLQIINEIILYVLFISMVSFTKHVLRVIDTISYISS